MILKVYLNYHDASFLLFFDATISSILHTSMTEKIQLIMYYHVLMGLHLGPYFNAKVLSFRWVKTQTLKYIRTLTIYHF